MHTDEHRFTRLYDIRVYPCASVVNNFYYLLIVIVFSYSLTACSTASQSFHNNAIKNGLSFESIQGNGFRHAVYLNKALTRKEYQTLHVYIGSDGTPWFEHRSITRDPTPLRPVLIDFVRKDKQPAIYLGRPCYHQLESKQENCTEDVWTSGRYSSHVVESMTQALKSYIVKYRYENIQLIGYSGGGSLAMLIAPRIKQVRSVITLAGNLDTNAWTRHHRYLPLKGSLNPAKQPALHAEIQQVHFIGDRDKNITVLMLTHALKNQARSKLVVLTDIDHSCCWLEQFTKIEKLLQQGIEEGH